MAGTGSESSREAGPRRIWIVAVLFGVVSAVVLAGIVILATGSTTADTSTSAAVDPPATGSTASSAEDPPVASDVDGRATVVILGDSITEQGEEVLEAGLAPEWSLVIDGRSGFTITEQLPAAEDLAEGRPRQVIVNLGTNDVMHGDDLEVSADNLRTLLAGFSEAECVHLVTVNEGIEMRERSMRDRSAELNEVIVDLAAADPRVTVIDWSATVAADEAGPGTDGPLLGDTVHPTARGQRVLTDLYADALRSCPAPG